MLAMTSATWRIQLSRRSSPLLHARLLSSTTTTTTTTTTTQKKQDAKSEEPVVSVQDDEELPGVKHVILNRPSKLNGLNMDMFHQLEHTALNLQNDTSIRAVLLRGNGRAFCTGLDVKSIAWTPRAYHNCTRLLHRPSHVSSKSKTTADDPRNSLGNLAQNVAYLWRVLPIPVIAVLHGMCFGGGFQIAMGADMRYCTPECQLSIMESKWGLIPDMSLTVTLRELGIGIDVAKELTMTGRIINGEEAVKVGLVTRCVEDPLQEAKRVIAEILERSPDSVSATKQLYHETWTRESEAECLEIETRIQRRMIGSWNQIVAAGRNFGMKSIPYRNRQGSFRGPPNDARKS